MEAKAMRWFAIAAPAVIFAVLLGAQRAPSQGESPQASLTLSKTRYLSTEGASATLFIHNTTSEALLYNPLSVRFVIRGDDGSSYERSMMITVVSRPIPSVSIAPGERQRFEIGLPTCDVVSDPCNEHVSVRLSLVPKNRAASIPLATSEVSYSFVADPTATYRVTDLRGNRPLFFAQYEAVGSVLQRLLIVRFQFAAAASTYQTASPEGNRIKQMFEQRGVVVPGFGITPNAAGFQIAIPLRDRDADAMVQGAIDDVRRAYGSRVKLESELFAPDDFDVIPFVDEALEGARAQAQRMSDSTGGGALSLAGAPQFDDAEILNVARDGDRSQTDFRPLSDYLFGGSLGDRTASATKGLLNIRLRATFAFLGDTVASGSLPSPPGYAELAYRGDASQLLGLPERAILAADRPEIYAVGVTTRQASDRLGLQAAAVATALAAARVRALARQLGVSAAAWTLFAAYPEVESPAQEEIVATGIATAPNGDLDRGWRTLLPAKRTLLPVNGVAPPTPQARAPQASQATYLVPISVPDDRTLLVVRADKPSAEFAGRFGQSACDDCESLVVSAQKQSLDEALRSAIERATMAGKQLRHLVLAIAEPPTLDRTGALVHAPVELIFRTR